MSKKQIIGIGIVAALIAIFIGIKIYADKVVEAKVDKAIAKAANYIDIEYEDVSVDLIGMNIRVSDIVIYPPETKERIKIDELIIYDIDTKSAIPAFLSMECKGIEFNIAERSEAAKQLRELGYDNKMMVNLQLDFAYDKENKEINVKKLGIGADELGELKVSFHLGNISLEPEAIAGLLFTFPQVVLHKAKIEYRDDSLVESLMQYAAYEQQMDVDDFQEFLIDNIDREIAQEKDELAQEALSEIKEFIEDPEQLSILISPEKSYPLERIMRAGAPNNIIKLLNIQIES